MKSRTDLPPAMLPAAGPFARIDGNLGSGAEPAEPLPGMRRLYPLRSETAQNREDLPMTGKRFAPRSAAYWSRRAWDRRLRNDDTLTSGPASDIRLIDPKTGDVIDDIQSDEEPRSLGRWKKRRAR